MKYTLLPLFLIALTKSFYAQSYDFENKKYQWPNNPTVKIPVEDIFKKNDIVILDEVNDISITKDGDYYIKKYLRFKVLTDNGLKKVSSITLPESFDHSADYYEVPIEKREQEHRPIFMEMQIEQFASRIIKSDGTFSENKLHYKTIKKTTFNPYSYSVRHPFVYTFYIDGLSVNDEVEIVYKYSVPSRNYYLGTTGRYFFHGNYPKQNYTLNVKYYSNLYCFINFNGAAISDSSISKDPEVPNSFTWKRNNLFGIENECGAHFHENLPYVGYYKHYGDYGLVDVSDPYNPVIKKLLPYNWEYILKRYVGYRDEDVKYVLSRTDDNTRYLNKLYADQTADVKDAVAKMNKIHQTISNEFDYKRSYARYQEDNYFDGIGKSVEKKLVHEKDMNRLYREMLIRLNGVYYKVYAPDKRFENINPDIAFPLITDKILFALPYQTNCIYYCPKADRFGYQPNELPFYREDSRVILIANNMDSLTAKNTPIIKFAYLPYSSESANFRTTYVQTDVNIDSAKANFHARLSLSGQFSTLIRGAYKYNFRDSSVNEKYYKKIYNISPQTKLISKEITSEAVEYPYKTNLRVKYEAGRVVQKKDSIVTLNLTNWFNHIIYDNFSAEDRHLPFCIDFKSLDKFTYRIKFDKNINVLNASDFEASIDNALGKYSLTIKQLSENEIEIESQLIESTDVIPANKAVDIEEIYSKIQKLNSGSLKIKII